MAEIISTKKRPDGSFVSQIILSEDEHLNLQGHTEKLTVFSDQINPLSAGISQRGKNGATKYFLIPRILRKDIDFQSQVTCHKLTTEQKVLFVYAINQDS